MKMISCIAIDDEPLALGLIASYIKKTPFLELLATFDNPLDTVDFLEDNDVQLIFLDIQMPDLTGMDFAHILDKRHKIIFTTAYSKYAVESYRIEALDYLLKPISYEIFLNAVNRAKNYFDLLLNDTKATNNSKDNPGEEYLFLKADFQLHKIHYQDILYFEGLKDYIKLYLKSSPKAVVFHSTMKAVESKLPCDKFMRVHRSYIVNLFNIQIIEKYRIIYGNKYIPISAKYRDAFDRFINKKHL